MVPADGSTILHETPIIHRSRIAASKEEAIELGQIVSRNVKTENGGVASRPPRFHVSPIAGFVKPRRRVEA
jgi:hypothetical protein